MKTKKQKQEEALKRKLKFLDVHRLSWETAQLKVTGAIITAANNGDSSAEGLVLRAEECRKSFAKAAAEAGVDLHGNLFDNKISKPVNPGSAVIKLTPKLYDIWS